VHAHPGLREPGQQPLRRVSVAVVLPDRDQGDAGTAGRQEGRIGICAPVMRDLQHVRTQVDPGREDPRLGLCAQIAGEQDPHPALGDPDDHRQVVRLGGRSGPLWFGGEHLDRRTADRPPVTRHEDRTLRTTSSDEPVECACPFVGRSQRAGGHHPDLATGQCTGEPSGVIGVQMRHENEREDVDPEPVKAAVDRPDVRPGIDQDPGTWGGGYDEGVSLPDVTGDDEGVGRRPAPDHLAQGPADRDQPHQHGQGERTQAGEPPQRPRSCQEQGGQQGRTAGAGRPSGGRVRRRGRALGDHDEPARRPAGAPDQEIRERRTRRTHDGCRQSEHGGRGDRGRREEVRRQGDQADGSGEAGDEGRRR
jgi:hypothetical protein